MSDDEVTEAPNWGKRCVKRKIEGRWARKVTVQYGEMLVKSGKEKRSRKTGLTKLKYRLQNLFMTKDGREEIESCIEKIWVILEKHTQ